jgi:hypothetical protein
VSFIVSIKIITLHPIVFAKIFAGRATDRGRLPTADCSRRACEVSFGGGCMSITTYLDDFDADLETKTVLGVALERTRVSLGLVDKFANGIIAKRIIELAKAGERNPDVLSEGALKVLRGHLFGD